MLTGFAQALFTPQEMLVHGHTGLLPPPGRPLAFSLFSLGSVNTLLFPRAVVTKYPASALQSHSFLKALVTGWVILDPPLEEEVSTSDVWLFPSSGPQLGAVWCCYELCPYEKTSQVQGKVHLRTQREGSHP